MLLAGTFEPAVCSLYANSQMLRERMTNIAQAVRRNIPMCLIIVDLLLCSLFHTIVTLCFIPATLYEIPSLCRTPYISPDHGIIYKHIICSPLKHVHNELTVLHPQDESQRASTLRKKPVEVPVFQF